MKSSEFWSADNVSSFNGNTVENGEVSLSDSEYEEILNDIYGEMSVCGQTFCSGSILVDADPITFSCMKGDYEDSLQTELEDQLSREDPSGIEFIEELDEEEEEDE